MYVAYLFLHSNTGMIDSKFAVKAIQCLDYYLSMTRLRSMAYLALASKPYLKVKVTSVQFARKHLRPVGG